MSHLTSSSPKAREHLAGMIEDLLGVENGKGDADGRHIDRLFRAVHSVKGGAGFFGCRVIESLAHAMEEVLEGLRRREVVAPGPPSSICSWPPPIA